MLIVSYPENIWLLDVILSHVDMSLTLHTGPALSIAEVQCSQCTVSFGPLYVCLFICCVCIHVCVCVCVLCVCACVHAFITEIEVVKSLTLYIKLLLYIYDPTF